jgi:SAM-dependent methyltransferase
VSGRGRWQGMMAIARFNWPLYVVAVVVAIVLLGVVLLTEATWVRLAAGLGLAAALYFLVGSLGVSHWVYDRSDLYRLDWVGRALGGRVPERMVFCHSGFDEASGSLREKFPEAEWVLLDHFDEETMTEASIRRARRLFPPVGGTVRARFGEWPVEEGRADVVWGMLAIHELRSEAERTAWFAEAARVLGHGGRVVLVEHVRDAANFVAFGPGYVHFHSVASWRRCWERAGLAAVEDFRVTPFLRVFVLQK